MLAYYMFSNLVYIYYYNVLYNRNVTNGSAWIRWNVFRIVKKKSIWHQKNNKCDVYLLYETDLWECESNRVRGPGNWKKGIAFRHPTAHRRGRIIQHTKKYIWLSTHRSLHRRCNNGNYTMDTQFVCDLKGQWSVCISMPLNLLSVRYCINEIFKRHSFIFTHPKPETRETRSLQPLTQTNKITCTHKHTNVEVDAPHKKRYDQQENPPNCIIFIHLSCK